MFSQSVNITLYGTPETSTEGEVEKNCYIPCMDPQ